MTDVTFSNEQIAQAKKLIISFRNGDPYDKLKEIATSANLKFADINSIELDRSYKYLYGNSSLIITCGKAPFFRIAGQESAYRIMTATTSDNPHPDINEEFFSLILRVSELISKLIEIKPLRLVDHLQRPFNVLFEFKSLNKESCIGLLEFTWVYLLVGLNEELFNAIASNSSNESSSNGSLRYTPATQLWENDQLRIHSTAQEELSDLHFALNDGEEGEDVYLMDGCWLTPDGRIVEK